MNTRQIQLITLLIVIVSFFSPSIIIAKNVELLPDPVISTVQVQCATGGCSGEICTDASAGPIYSTCQWKEEYACLPKAKCEIQTAGKCGWTYTEEYNQCASGNPVQPTTPPELPITCGNNICEAGEADTITGGCPEGSPSSCLGPPMQLINGSCPSDCPNPTVQPKPTATPIVPTISINPTVTATPTTQILPTLSEAPEIPQIGKPVNPIPSAFTRELVSRITQAPTRRAQVIQTRQNATALTLYDRVLIHIRSLLPNYFI